MIAGRCLCVALLLGSISSANESSSSSPQVVFSRDVLPILKAQCVACHNERDSEGGVRLESRRAIKESDLDSLLVVGDADASQLFAVAAHTSEPVMPPEDNDVSARRLTQEELLVLRRWIESGAEDLTDAPAPAAPAPAAPVQPMPPQVRSVMAAAMTPDGRLTAVGRANRLQLFAADSQQPIFEAVRADGSPAHDDFIRDLWLSPDGKTILSSGFRNVKRWQFDLLTPIDVPEIAAGVAFAVNQNATHAAELSPRGEVTVGQLGRRRGDWMRGFDLPAELDTESVMMAIGIRGEQVAVTWENQLRVLSVDHKAVESVSLEYTATALAWETDGRLLVGDASGQILSDQPFDDAAPEQLAEGKTAIAQLVVAGDGIVLARDTEGNAFTVTSDKQVQPMGTLPGDVTSLVVPRRDAKTAWFTTAAGVLGRLELESKQSSEIAKSDPSEGFRYNQQQWRVSVATALTKSAENQLKTLQESESAEKKNLEKLTKEIETRTKNRDEKQSELAESETKRREADQSLKALTEEQKDANQKRKELAEKLTRTEARLAEIENEQKQLETQLANIKKQQAELPAESDLSAKVKTASEQLQKNEKDVETKRTALQDAEGTLQRFTSRRDRSQSRIQVVADQVTLQTEAAELLKEQQRIAEKDAEHSKTKRDESKAVRGSVAASADGRFLITRGNDGWNLWSGEGQWLCNLTDVPADAQAISLSAERLIVRLADGRLSAYQIADRPWTLKQMFGESLFRDLVLSLDVNHNASLLATGGGEPAKSGDLMLWNLDDGNLMRNIPDPHEDTVLSVRFSPDGRTLATGGADRMICLWDVSTGKRIKQLEGHTGHVTCLQWSVDGKQLASGSADASVKLWDIELGKATRTISGFRAEINRLAFVGTEDRIAVLCGDGNFSIYRTDNGRREVHTQVAAGYPFSLASDSRGTQFVVGDDEGTASRLDKSGKVIGRNE